MFIENRQKISKGFDATLIILYMILVTIGWFTIFSSSYDANSFVSVFNIKMPYGRQLIWIGTSLLIVIVTLLIDHRFYLHYAYYIYAFCLLLLISVLIFGTEISGNKAWIKIGNFSIQPSEFMKMAVALALAKFFNEGKTNKGKRNVWLIALGIIFLPVIVIMLQNDTGSALVYTAFILLFYREGMSVNILLLGFLVVTMTVTTLYFKELYTIAALLTLYLILLFFNRKQKKRLIYYTIFLSISIAFVFAINFGYENILKPHQKQRIESMFGKTSDPKGVDYNVSQSKIAIGSGGLTGKGFLKGTQTKFNFIPEQSTDFIFCGIGEEWGFLGSFVLIALFVWLILRIIFLAERHRNPFVRYYGYSIAGIIFFHFAINLGMTIGVAPIIGIPLPFISYGGSSLWAFTTMLFIFIRLNDS